MSSTYLNQVIAEVDRKRDKSYQQMNCGNFSINIYLLSKTEPISDVSFKNLEYNKNVTSIYLNDDLNNIGLDGYFIFKNTSSFYDIFLSRYNLYYVVLSIYEKVTDDFVYQYEPYIFDITNVQNLGDPTKEDKILKVYIQDIVTSILSHHSIGSVIKMYPDITHERCYKKVIEHICNYVKGFIKSTTNEKYEYKKDLLYSYNVKCNNNIINGYDADANMVNLIISTFSKIPNDASIMEALRIIMQDACTTLHTPLSFKNVYKEIGNVLIPFFFKEEYDDKSNFYPTLWVDEITNQEDSEDSNELSNQTVNDLEKNVQQSLMYRRRSLTMRDIYMPFFIAFHSDKSSGVYEYINPTNTSDKKTVASINGYYQKDIFAVQFNPVDVEVLRKMWKNVIFVDTYNDGAGGSNCTLIFFSWFFDYFKNVFLKNNGVVNVFPQFHLLSRKEQIAHATTDGSTKENLFDEYNSYVYATQTSDVIGECLRVAGKNIASFILANSSYTFRLEGNLLRRPNEILRIGATQSDASSQRKLSFDINLDSHEDSFVYVKRVIHRFSGTEYFNEITCCPFCEILK